MEKISGLDRFKEIKEKMKKYLTYTIPEGKVFKVYKQKNGTAVHCLFSGQSFVNYDGEIRAVNRRGDDYVVSQRHDLVGNLINTLFNAADDEYYIDYKVEQKYILSEESRAKIKCFMDLGVKEFNDYHVTTEYTEVQDFMGYTIYKSPFCYIASFSFESPNLQGKFVIDSDDILYKEMVKALIKMYADGSKGISLEELYNAKEDVEFIMETEEDELPF